MLTYRRCFLDHGEPPARLRLPRESIDVRGRAVPYSFLTSLHFITGLQSRGLVKRLRHTDSNIDNRTISSLLKGVNDTIHAHMTRRGPKWHYYNQRIRERAAIPIDLYDRLRFYRDEIQSRTAVLGTLRTDSQTLHVINPPVI
ncbi:hypothetical protein J6590_027453 [Homalodisca vitripennis]|nr:hypothetical protein J6590_027453 [Homalodisca vitripennis]